VPSSPAPGTPKKRLGTAAERISWLVGDITTIRLAPNTYDVWHDRAVFHFLTAESDRRAYRRVLAAATAVDAVAVFGCFAPEGPPQCSGLPVARYGPRGIAAELGRDWAVVAEDREDHATPAGLIQPFTWVALRRNH